MKCPNCSFENPEGAAFCNKCGTKINELKEPDTQKKEESSFRKKISSFFFIGSIIFLIYILICIKFPSRQVDNYRYDDHTQYEAFYSDPLTMLTCQPGSSSVSEKEALNNAKTRYITILMFFGGIGVTVCIVSAWLKNK